MAAARAREVVAFWREAGNERWFGKDAGFDAEILDKFGAGHHAAARGELADWTGDWEGSLALLILLDQFPRNIFRGSGHAFATDGLARALAAQAIDRGHDTQAQADLRVFFYLPFEHSELLADQDRCVALCDALDAATGSEWAKWARMHRDIIVRFGRFPHRNAALGRESTAEEARFLAEGGFAG